MSPTTNPPPSSARREFSFGAILLGAFLCFSILVLLGALAAGIGLVHFNLERGETPKAAAGWIGAAYGFIALVISFFVGGFAASRMSRQSSRSGCLWHGLGTWSLVVVSLAFIVGSLASSVTGFLAQAGIGAGAAAGAAGSVDEISRQLSKIRIVTDMSILKGKAVTQIIVPERGQQLAGTAARVLPQEIKSAKKGLAPDQEAKHEIKQAAGTVRKAAGGASFGAFGILLIGAITASLGALFSRRFVLRES